MNRRRDWESQLRAFIEENRNRPFTWGSWDCCTSAADWVNVMTGVDPAQSYRGRYRSKIGAYKALKKRGHDDVVSATSEALGPTCPVMLARRGDIVAMPCVYFEAACGVVCPDGKTVAIPGETGFEFFPLHDGLSAWRVG